MSEVLLDPTGVELALRRITAELLERSQAHDGQMPVLIGIRRGGAPLARRIAQFCQETCVAPALVGEVDITLYRDDAATALPNPRIGPSRIPFSVDGRHVVLVDDVISTGRTIRAALDAVLDFGRPRRIELAALIDRGGRELPIQPDYVGLRTQVASDKRVEVIVKQTSPGDGTFAPHQAPVAGELPATWAILVSPTAGQPTKQVTREPEAK